MLAAGVAWFGVVKGSGALRGCDAKNGPAGPLFMSAETQIVDTNCSVGRRTFLRFTSQSPSGWR